MTLGIVRRTEEEFAEWLATESGFVAGLCSYDDEPIELEQYQRAFLQNRSRFRWVKKSRQIGFSFIFALEALARCHLRDKHTAIFVSYNLEDAKEKILIARQIHEDLPLAYQKRLVVDSKTELAFEPNGAKGKLSRIISHPSKAPRGKKGDTYLDELAHYLNDREVYKGSTALILRAHGQLTGCSTPLGRRGIFWEISEEELRRYPHHSRQIVPWWLCRFFCHDVRRASQEARGMPTEERVATFGKPALIEQFDSLPVEDFQQEFECLFVDESYSYFPYDLILPCTQEINVRDDPTTIAAPVGRIVAGYDVGRTRDKSELSVFEEVDGRFKCVMLKSFAGAPFVVQEGELLRLLETLPVARLSIDQSGLGRHLTENLQRRYPNIVRGEDFTGDNKERWATNFKILLQKQEVILPKNRELVAQIHSVKRRVLPSGRVSFDGERDQKGHADKFWSIALAVQKEHAASLRNADIRVRIIG